MGLFDIFRRKKKEKKQPEEQTPAVKNEQQTGDGKQQSAADQDATTPVSTESADQTATVDQQTTDERQQPTNQEGDASQEASTSDENEDSADQSSTTDQQQEKTAEPSTSEEQSNQPNSVDEHLTVSAADTTEPKPADNSAQPTEEAASEEKNTPTVSTTADEASKEAAKSETARYDRGLKKSRTGFGARLNRFLANFRHVDEDFFEDLEDLLIESDVGVDMAMKLSDELRDEVKLQNAHSKQDVSNVIIEKMLDLYEEAGAGENNSINWAQQRPTVIMFVGVNGAGKTTTIGKMAAREKKNGKKVLLAAADTFRAGATEQLEVWAERDGVDIVTGPENGDPAAVVFDAVKKAKEEDYDVLFVDTAGRLQNKVNLMKELAKMKRILTREIPDAPHEVLLVLDATTGQNALTQAKLFKESTDVTGIVLTKLDGTARGGIVLAIRNELHLPVKFVGLGEQVNDLQAFDSSEFIYGLFKGLVEE